MKEFLKKIILEKHKKYLPSKKFAIITSIIIALATLIFVIFFMSSSGENFMTRDKNKQARPVVVGNPTLTDLVQKDGDEDGIADWEEALWGTDPNKKITFNDMPDATYIGNKKKTLKIEQNVSVSATNLTETEKFAREFFTSYSAMKSSGQVDGDAINSFSNALGQKIVDPNLVDRYKNTDIKINVADDTTSKKKYYTDVQSLFKNYKKAGIGDELDIVSKGLAEESTNGSTKNADQYAKLLTIGNAYQNFAKKVIELSVPQSLLDYHLRIANNANNTGISVLNLEKISSDPIIGLSGVSQYQKYSENLIKSVTDLENFLLKQ